SAARADLQSVRRKARSGCGGTGYKPAQAVIISCRSRGFAIRAQKSEKRMRWHGLQTRASGIYLV
ncbi:MAG: hypothetical protein LBR10_15610, partial [Prevotellaceae bacterium]|nr:hypothetical protein [Prevotellaceae bacterium]